MKEKISEVLNDEAYETVEEKTDAIAKEIAKLTVPKDKYNKMSERVQSLETEKSDLESELEDIKTKSMTDDEKFKKQQEDYDKKSKQLSIELNKVKAREIFKNAEIDNEKIDDLLEKVVSESESKTLELANSFVDILSVKIDETQKKTETNLLENTPKPNIKAGNQDPKVISKEDFINMDYSEKKTLLATNPEQYNQLLSEISK